LLEAAVQVPQPISHLLHYSLAECLLNQQQDSNRALELIEQVIEGVQQQPVAKRSKAFLAHCLALRAWALASCQSRAEAESSLQEAHSQFKFMGKHDCAELLNLEGKIWIQLENCESARVAFEKALLAFPHGTVAMHSQRGLDRIGKNKTD
jgi:tetratricopeptide (TPR) repeat protein